MTLLGTLRRAPRKNGALSPSSALVLLFAVGLAHAAPDPDKLYDTHCLSTHAPNRLVGPARPRSCDELLAEAKNAVSSADWQNGETRFHNQRLGINPG